MVYVDLLFSFAIAFGLTVVQGAVFLNLGLRFPAVSLFTILLGGTWGGGQLLVPMGPPLWGVTWLSLFVAGFLCAVVSGAILLLPHAGSVRSMNRTGRPHRAA